MKPAFSVIFLTTLIGVGQGFFIALYAAELLAQGGGLAAPDGRGFYVAGSVIALLFLIAGLAASFLHLGHPERAWRAAAMWRTSWLSREVIVLPALMLVIFVYALGHFYGSDATLVTGAVAVVLSIALFVCTGMIYACIRFLQEWASPLTLTNYFLLGSASGFTLASAFAYFTAPHLMSLYTACAIVLTLTAFVSRGASLVRNAHIRPKSTLQSATGLRHPRVVQKAQGSMGGSYNTRQFFHHASPQRFRHIKCGFLLAVFPVPVVLLAGGALLDSAALLVTAFVVQYAGLIAERWFFFAQANHPQNLYYQYIS
ncbi:MAG TPA: dimethyl sulfoxide reductase anchor subunit [Rhodocyclaceae bacterium]|nr:dimethyl sulfoxide reductase anchor subunit [Rhodocyclaceae bacterium]